MPTPRDEQHVKTMFEGINNTAELLGLNRPTYDGKPVLTVDKAEQAERKVGEWFINNGFQQSELPVMYRPGHEGPMWVLSLEGGPEDWPMQVCEALHGKWPAGVFAEPVASWCLGLYPA
jgi:hypothetical protein